MAEYYALYRESKHDGKTTTYATFLGEISDKIINGFKKQVEATFSEEQFGIVIHKKKMLSYEKALVLQELLDNYENDGHGNSDWSWRHARCNELYIVEELLEKMQELEKDPSVVWSGDTGTATDEAVGIAILVYSVGEDGSETLDALYSIGRLTKAEREATEHRFTKQYKGWYHPKFVEESTLPTDLSSKVEFDDLRKKFESGRLSAGRAKPIWLALECANTVRSHTGRADDNIDIEAIRNAIERPGEALVDSLFAMFSPPSASASRPADPPVESAPVHALAAGSEDNTVDLIETPVQTVRPRVVRLVDGEISPDGEYLGDKLNVIASEITAIKNMISPKENADFDKTGKEWVKTKEAAPRLGVTEGSLERYRPGGTKPNGDRPGVDIMGNVWKYEYHGKRQYVVYLLPVESPDK